MNRANVREFRRPVKEYQAGLEPRPTKVYYKPHVVGKPIECYQETIDELFQGWFRDCEAVQHE